MSCALAAWCSKGLIPLCQCPSRTGKSKTEHSPPGSLTRPSRGQRITFSNLLATLLLVEPRMVRSSMNLQDALLTHIGVFLSIGTLRTFYAVLLWSQLVPSLSCCMIRNLHWLVLNLKKFLPDIYSSLLRMLWMLALHINCSPNQISSMNLLRALFHLTGYICNEGMNACSY